MSDDIERCQRCRRPLDDHASAVVDERERRLICPTSKGQALDQSRAVWEVSES